MAGLLNGELRPYFVVPKGLICGRIAARIGPHGTAVYVALCEHANRKGNTTFSVSDEALAADTGVAPRTIRNIRTKLVEAKLITCSAKPGQSHIYTLLRVDYDWIPVKDRLRKKRRRRALHASRLTLVEARQSQAALANLAIPSGKIC